MLDATAHGSVIMVITRVASAEAHERPRPRVGGYRSDQPLTAEEIDAALREGFGDSDRR